MTDGMISPEAAGFVRAPKFDGLSKQHPDWEVWRTPEGVLLTLPPDCSQIKMIEHGRKGGGTITNVCIHPPGVTSIWPHYLSDLLLYGSASRKVTYP